MSASILLVDPKYDFNVGGAVRASAIFGASPVRWTGERIGNLKRLPREERMAQYNERVRFGGVHPANSLDYIEMVTSFGVTPVAVELRENAEPLDIFVHPERVCYVFGPEDGSLGGPTLSRCHRFVCIPGAIRTPLNLAAAVNIVLYDRFTKESAGFRADSVLPASYREL